MAKARPAPRVGARGREKGQEYRRKGRKAEVKFVDRRMRADGG